MGEPAQVSNIKTNFKPVTDLEDLTSLLQQVAASQIEVLVRIQGAPGVEATIYKAKKWTGTKLHADYVSGPLLVTAPILFALEVRKIWYCFAGTIHLGEDPKSQGSLDFSLAYEVQRRESHRVVIPDDSLKAEYYVPSLKRSFKILDLSEGGVGLYIEKDEAELFPPKTVFPGTIRVEGHEPVEGLSAENMHLKPEGEGFKAGCQFTNTNLATKQKVAFLVNACYRDVFGFAKMRT